MSKLGLVEKMEQMLQDLKTVTTELNGDVTSLTTCIAAGEFVSEVLKDRIIEELKKVSELQENLKQQFAILKIGAFSSKVQEMGTVLEEYKKSVMICEKYRRAVDFFMSLCAEDADTQELLEIRKKELAVLDLETMDLEALKEEIEGYVMVFDALHEKEAEPERRFSLMYGLSRRFEEPIVKGICFGTLKEAEQACVIEATKEDTDKAQSYEAAKEVVDTQIQIKLSSEQKTAIEAGGDAELSAEAGNVQEKAVESKAADGAGACVGQAGDVSQVPTAAAIDHEEDMEHMCENFEEQPEEIWKRIGIEEPEKVIWKGDESLLKVTALPKANGKFSVKEFKKDIIKHVPELKIVCLKEAFESCTYSVESIALWKNSQQEIYEFASEKLMQSGYLIKYTLKGLGEFFGLSPKGMKAFSSKDALSFMHMRFYEKQFVETDMKAAQASINPAVARVLYNSCFGKVLKLNEDYKFKAKIVGIGKEYFSLSFPNVSEEKKVTYIGIVSEDPEQFEEVYTLVTQKEEDMYIIVAATHELAANISKWIADTIQNRVFVGYCGLQDEEVFDAQSDLVWNFEIAKTAEVPEICEAVQTQQVLEACEEVQSEEASDICETVQEEPVSEVSVVEHEGQTAEVFTAVGTVGEEASHDEVYQNMLISGKSYAAVAYVKALEKDIPYYNGVYQQLAYALNDPMCGCCYNSDTIFSIYYNNNELVSEYFMLSAVIRNYFYDQFGYDYSLQQLYNMVLASPVLKEMSSVGEIIYILQQFKTVNHRGLDRYADYREKEKACWEFRLEEVKKEARWYYDNYCGINLKENASHKRFIETEKSLLGPNSELSDYLQFVVCDDREMLESLKEFLREHYVKNHAEICAENIDFDKINDVLDIHWELAAQNMRLVKKTSDLMSSLRTNLFKKVRKIVVVLCEYVRLMETAVFNEDDPALGEYKKNRKKLLEDISQAITEVSSGSEKNLKERAGKAVLLETLQEIKARVEGDYKEGSNKYFYVDFLRNGDVILDDEFFPVLDDVLELPEFCVLNRIIHHCQKEKKGWEERLEDIFNGDDDYGSAELILKYMETQGIALTKEDYKSFSMEAVIEFPKNDMENKRREFIEDLELAQSYGQIDNTTENTKDIIVQIMEYWYEWAKETKSFGFFNKILTAFRARIHKNAETRAVELEKSLAGYLDTNVSWQEDKVVADAVGRIKDRICQQNYTAAEDLLNRLFKNDLDFDYDIEQTDYFAEFLNEYDVNYKGTVNASLALKSLVNMSKLNKDTRGAEKLLESWPRGAGVGEYTLRKLLQALGFVPDTVKAEAAFQASKLESYVVNLQRPQNGRKNNYKHPISAFGSEAEDKGFRVVCIFGKFDASRLIDTFKEIGNTKNTIILLDYALTLADRRKLARKTKTDLNGKIFAVIDRVVLVYLAKHYTETAVNRMLMSVIMPFASYQPYIHKSADIMPPEIFIGREGELEKIESATGVNIVYGGRQLGKTALLRMAQKNIDKNENGDRAIIVDVWGKDYRETAEEISEKLYAEGILKQKNVTQDWSELARDIKNRLRDEQDPIPYLLLLIDEADAFIESCEAISYQPFKELKDIQSIGSGRFKFVVAGLRDIVRFKRMAALGNNSVLVHLDSITIKPFKYMEARKLLEVPLFYLGFRFPKDNETEVLISTIFGTTNYFPGLIQMYCTKLIEAMKRDYAGYLENNTPPYYVQKQLIKKVLAEQSLQQDIKNKFFVTLEVAADGYYYIIALLVAYHYHENKLQNDCNASELLELAKNFSIRKLYSLDEEKINALMEEMQELNVFQHIGNGRYRFTSHNFCQMMGTVQQIEDELLKYMED